VASLSLSAQLELQSGRLCWVTERPLTCRVIVGDPFLWPAPSWLRLWWQHDGSRWWLVFEWRKEVMKIAWLISKCSPEA
jgi:hypothetical protein